MINVGNNNIYLHDQQNEKYTYVSSFAFSLERLNHPIIKSNNNFFLIITLAFHSFEPFWMLKNKDVCVRVCPLRSIRSFAQIHPL